MLDATGEVSAVVSPRETYRHTRRTVERLLEEAGLREIVVVTEGHAPRRLLRWLDGASGVRHVHRSEPTGANECRMLGVDASTAPFVLLADNDCLMSRGAVTSLLERAHATDASFVSPVIDYEIGGVHFAGGTCHLEDEPPHTLVDFHVHDRAFADPQRLPPPCPTESGEMHAVLVRRDALDAAGGLDRSLRSSMDVIDLSLRLNGWGGGGWVEPRARGTYDNHLPHLRELPFFWSRWGRPTVDHDIESFRAAWDVREGDQRMEDHRQSCSARRLRPVRFLRGGLRRTLGEGAAASFDRRFDRVIARYAPPL
jgi:hypothetical protein